MKRIILLPILLAFLCYGCVSVPVTPTADEVEAEPEAEIEMEADIPEVAVEAEPELIAMENDVYFIPAITADIFFYGGWWWRSYGGYWYRSHIHTGYWVRWGAPPSVILMIPLHEYRHRYLGRPHVLYRTFRSHHVDYRPELHRPPRHWDRRVERQRQQERERIRKIEQKQVKKPVFPKVEKAIPPTKTVTKTPPPASTITKPLKQYPDAGRDYPIKSQIKKQYPQEGHDTVQKIYKPAVVKSDDHDFQSKKQIRLKQQKTTIQKSPVLQKSVSQPGSFPQQKSVPLQKSVPEQKDYKKKQ